MGLTYFFFFFNFQESSIFCPEIKTSEVRPVELISNYVAGFIKDTGLLSTLMIWSWGLGLAFSSGSQIFLKLMHMDFYSLNRKMVLVTKKPTFLYL